MTKLTEEQKDEINDYYNFFDIVERNLDFKFIKTTIIIDLQETMEETSILKAVWKLEIDGIIDDWTLRNIARKMMLYEDFLFDIDEDSTDEHLIIRICQ